MTTLKHYIIVFLISMVPLIELRGAIPYAVGFDLPLGPSIALAVLGNMLPVPLIFLFARRILDWGKDKKVIGGFCRCAWKRGTRAGRNSRPRPERACTSPCSCSSGSPSREPVPGPERWRPAYWTWISRKACCISWAASSSPESLCCWPHSGSSAPSTS